MKVVNFILAGLAIVIALAAVGLSFRGIMFSRFAGSSWNSWAITEQVDAVIFDSGGWSRGVTVCNRSFRRNDGRNVVAVHATRGHAVSQHVVNHGSCISVRGELVEVKKPDGESFAARGRYKLERGSWRGRTTHRDGQADQDEAAAESAPTDMTAPMDMTAPLDVPVDGEGAPEAGDDGN